MSTIIIYGIPNCDAVKKTLDWFKKHKKTIVFYNYKKESISKEKLTAWCKQLGWEILLNKKSTLEPRAAINWMVDNTSSVHAGYGKPSTMEKLNNYFSSVQQSDGSVIRRNKSLDLCKADHYVVG